jgi:hypothetical protein
MAKKHWRPDIRDWLWRERKRAKEREEAKAVLPMLMEAKKAADEIEMANDGHNDNTNV